MTLQRELSRIGLLLDSGRHREALQQLRRLVATHPEDGELWGGIARAHIGLDEYQPAYEAALAMVRADPSSWIGHLYASLALAGLERNEEALSAAIEATRAEPGQWIGHSQVAEVASGMRKQRATAWAAANRAVELAPLESNAHATMGLVALRTRDLRVAESALIEALRLNPQNHNAQHNLGIVRLSKGQMVAATRDLGVAAAADPNSPMTRIAFRAVILRWLRNCHWALWGFWLVGRTLTAAGQHHEGFYWPTGLTALVALVLLAWWTRRTVVAVGGHLRGVLWRVLRRSILTSLWFAAVVFGTVTLLVGSLLPDPVLRDGMYYLTGSALLAGLLLSWMQVFAARR